MIQYMVAKRDEGMTRLMQTAPELSCFLGRGTNGLCFCCAMVGEPMLLPYIPGCPHEYLALSDKTFWVGGVAEPFVYGKMFVI